MPLLPPPSSSVVSVLSIVPNVPVLVIVPVDVVAAVAAAAATLVMPLCSPRSLLQRNIDPDPDLDPDLDIFINALKAAVPLDLFLLLLWGCLELDPDLVLASQEYPPIHLPSLLLTPLLSPSPSTLLRL